MKILKAGVIIGLVWFIGFTLFVWDSPKPRMIEEIEIQKLPIAEVVVEEDTTAEVAKEVEIEKEFVTVTVYNPVPGQCDDSPLITADNSKIDLDKLKKGKLKWVAVSRDLLKEGKVKYGDKIRLTCDKDPAMNGIFVVHDTMHPRWKKRIDVLAHQDVKTTGKQTGVMIEYLGDNV